MQQIVTPTEAEAAATAAGILAQNLRSKPDLVLGLATGRTMEGVYHHLVRFHREEGLDFTHCRTFNLDEYLGIPADHPGSYHHYMHDYLFNHVNLQAQNIHLPNGMTLDSPEECRAYERKIQEAGGLDLQLLGLGLTGHIGFNEPPAQFCSRTHECLLDERTRLQNAPYFVEGLAGVPTRAITMGIATILEARRCLLLVTGANKADILECALKGAVSTQVPGSILQTHPCCTLVADQAACATDSAQTRPQPSPGLPSDCVRSRRVS
jgi:glucosamine-6-phosphate deaminase